MPQFGLALLVLLAAAMHAGWNALVKAGRDRVMTLAAVVGVGAAGSALALPFAAQPARGSWPFLALGAAIHVGYFFFLLRAYRFGDLSHVYPVARGAAPLFVAAGAAVVAGEALGSAALGGLALLSAGIASFALERGRGAGADRQAFLFALGTALIIGAYTVVDGLGVRRSGSPLGYILWLLVIDGAPLTLYVLATRRRTVVPYVAAHWAPCLGGGLMAAAAYGLVIWALGRGAMAYVAALRETSVVFAAVIGAAWLGEPFGRRRVAAALLVAAGILLMNLGGPG